MNKDQIELMLKGSIVGHLLGDALGYPIENIEPLNKVMMLPGKFEEPPGSWVSPGAFTLATMQSINDCDGLDYDDLFEQFNNVYVGGAFSPDNECRDISIITSEAIKNYTNSMPIDKCGLQNTKNDNECLLRMLPIALYFSGQLDILIQNAHKVCSMTHDDVHSKVCCAAYCLLIRNLFLQRAEKVFSILSEYYTKNNLEQYLTELEKLKEYKNSNSLNGMKHIDDTFWSAWHCYSENENSFEKAMGSAIFMGNDTNSTACLTGSLAGLTNGLNDIPMIWIRELRLVPEAIDIIQKFINKLFEQL